MNVQFINQLVFEPFFLVLCDSIHYKIGFLFSQSLVKIEALELSPFFLRLLLDFL